MSLRLSWVLSASVILSASAVHGENRLAREKSPYLLQHAHNPVDWYPWGDEAFEKAAREKKPIFLSIGYATCHWCHVMERECFENEAIAKLLNEHFVAIKVDREERPDVDAKYMEVCMAMNDGSGGWPLSAFLAPSGEAFFAGTYFPPDRFRALLLRVVELWGADESRRAILEHAAEVAKALASSEVAHSEARELAPALAEGGFDAFRAIFDEENGGFGIAPKFPRSSVLDFLLRYASRTQNESAREMATRTLDAMIRGGIRDHVGGGFHRYSTDRTWLVPHFEKMLYDNAMIARTLVDASLAANDPRYLAVARETLDYLLRRMRHESGAFFSAEDADANGSEGLTYVWTRAEILDALGSERGRVFADFYGVGEEGNFREPREEGPSARSVLHIVPEGGAAELASLAEDRAKLLELRNRRPQPFLDDKILAGWNGLAISAFARAAQATGEERYLDAAEMAAAFVLDHMMRDGRLFRRYREGELAIPAFLEDHAFLAEGLLDLYEADFDRRFLEAALDLVRQTTELFGDADEPGFFANTVSHDERIAPRKEFYDGAVPSGNAVAYSNLLRAWEITGDDSIRTAIERFESLVAALLAEDPRSHPQLLVALEFTLARPLEIVIIGPRDEERTKSLLGVIRRHFLPAKVVLLAANESEAESLAKISPLFEGKQRIDGRPAVYVCRDRVCKLPVVDAKGLEAQLGATPEKQASGPVPERLKLWLESQKWERDTDGPILSLGKPGQFDDTHIFAPLVALDEDRFLLWYSGSQGFAYDLSPTRMPDERVFKLGLATSADGKRFERHEAAVYALEKDGLSILTPTVLRDAGGRILRENGAMRMWFSSATLGGRGQVQSIQHATSTDGVEWSRASPVLIERAYAPSVVKTEKGYEMWYTVPGRYPWVIRHARSDDGLKWDVSDEPVMEVSQDWEHDLVIYPAVSVIDGVYLMWYASYLSGDHLTTAIGFAASLDGITWYKHPENPVLRPAPDRDWESHYVSSQSVIRMRDGSFRMWYASRKKPPFQNLYFALNTARWVGPPGSK